MKKLSIFILIITLSLSLIGCGNTVTNKQVTLDLSYGQRSGIYTGEMKNDQPNGKGKFETKNDKGEPWYYEGEFKDGHFEGKGTCVWPNAKQKEEGIFKNDKMNGPGKRFINNIVVYDGNWKNGLLDGEGKEYDNQGKEVYSGTFENGYPMLPAIKIGESVLFADWDYKGIKYETHATIGNKTAQGIFVMVLIDITNNSKSPRELGANFFSAFDDQGRIFKMSSEASLEYYQKFKTKNWHLNSIGASFTGQIPIVFDVPKDVKNLKIVPTNGFGKAKPIFISETL